MVSILSLNSKLKMFYGKVDLYITFAYISYILGTQQVLVFLTFKI